jgi:hypothetical protein
MDVNAMHLNATVQRKKEKKGLVNTVWTPLWDFAPIQRFQRFFFKRALNISWA